MSNPIPPTGSAYSPAQPEPEPLPLEKPRRLRKALVLAAVGVVVVVLFGAFIKFGLSGGQDRARDAKAGDCLAPEGKVPTEAGTESDVQMMVVDCASPEAAYVVLDRVDGEDYFDPQACEEFFTDPSAKYLSYVAKFDEPYLLCLQVKTA